MLEYKVQQAFHMVVCTCQRSQQYDSGFQEAHVGIITAQELASHSRPSLSIDVLLIEEFLIRCDAAPAVEIEEETRKKGLQQFISRE